MTYKFILSLEATMCNYNSIGNIDIGFYDFEQKIDHDTLCIYSMFAYLVVKA